MHTPVLLTEVIEGLAVTKEGRYIDATAGEGGHMGAMLKMGARVLGIDRDASQIDGLRSRFAGVQDASFAVGNFADIASLAKEAGFAGVDGILFDLGLSYRQLLEGKRGLSYRNEGEQLDMRMGDGDKTAGDIVRTSSVDELEALFTEYAEEMRSRDIAIAIVSARRQRMQTVGELTRAIDRVPGTSMATYARVFQALRIAVNDEFANLTRGLDGAAAVIGKEGRIGVISFHSLEDRIVKRHIRERGWKQIHKKAIAGNADYRFERSAKLRIFTI